MDPKVDSTMIPNTDEATAVATPEATELTSTTPTTDSAKEKRRTSFFNNLGGRKERRAVGHGSTQPEAAMKTASTTPITTTANGGETKAKGANTTPLPKLGELFRKPSRGARAIFDQGKKGHTPVSTEPVPTSETGGHVYDPATTTTTD